MFLKKYSIFFRLYGGRLQKRRINNAILQLTAINALNTGNVLKIIGHHQIGILGHLHLLGAVEQHSNELRAGKVIPPRNANADLCRKHTQEIIAATVVMRHIVCDRLPDFFMALLRDGDGINRAVAIGVLRKHKGMDVLMDQAGVEGVVQLASAVAVEIVGYGMQGKGGVGEIATGKDMNKASGHSACSG